MGQPKPAALPFVQRQAEQFLHLGQQPRSRGLGNADPNGGKAKGAGVVKLGKQA